jgi:hypothetical protein
MRAYRLDAQLRNGGITYVGKQRVPVKKLGYGRFIFQHREVSYEELDELLKDI